MSIETSFLFPVDPEDFWKKIREIVQAEVQKINGKGAEYTVSGLVQKPLYKAHEVCAMLQISRQTLHTWVKEGILKQYKIKSRCFFLWTDLVALIHKKTS